MTERDKKGPDENEVPLNQKEGNDDALKNKQESKNQIESSAINGLNTLKESLAKNETHDVLKSPDWLSETTSQKTDEIQSEKGSPFGARVETDHMAYYSGKKPDRLLGKNPINDVIDFGIGAVDSVATVAKLTGHLVVDTAKFLRHPFKEVKRTQDILNNVG